MRIFVTGGAGYIGSHTVDLLVERGHEVIVFDNLSTGHAEAVHPQAELITGELLDKAAIDGALRGRGVEGIIHFASYTLVGESTQKPWLYLRDNVTAAANLIEAATAHGVARFIFSSTSNLFGNNVEIPIRPETPPMPASPYGESKHMIERLLYWAHALSGLAYCCLRYFNAAGAHPGGRLGEDHMPETHLIPIVIEAALGKRAGVTIYGDDYPTPDGTCIRDYIHVVDLAEAHLAALETLADGRPRTYNLGNNRGYSVREVVQTVEQVTGRKIAVSVGPRRAGDPAELIADATKARDELGWRPEFSTLPQIVETAWKWHLAHPEGYR
jgi:UDP-glucose 4-epimerase